MRVATICFLLTTTLISCGSDGHRSQDDEVPLPTPSTFPIAPTNTIANLPDGTAGDDEGVYDGSSAYETIALGRGADKLVLKGRAATGLSGHVDMGADDDEVFIEAGSWTSYDGGAAPGGEAALSIYGGTGTDTLIIVGGTIGSITGESDASDRVFYQDGEINGGILLGSGNDLLVLSNPDNIEDIEEEGYTIDMGGGDDEIIVTAGRYLGYSGAAAPSGARLCSEVMLGFITTRCLHGGGGVDTLRLSGGFISNIFGGGGKDIVIYEGGNGGEGISLAGGADEITLSAPMPDMNEVWGNDGEDSIILEEGAWTGYFGGHPPEGIGECGSNATNHLCIYGGADTDTFTLKGTGEIDYIIGDHDGSDIIILEAGELEFVHTGNNSGNNIVRILGTIGGTGDGADITFTGECLVASSAWICGGGGTDEIQYLASIAGFTAAITGNTRNIETICSIASADGAGRSGCAAPASLGGRAFASGIEEVGVSPELGLWGGLAPAMQGFGRAMMEDFTSNRAWRGHIAESPQLTPYPSHVPAGRRPALLEQSTQRRLGAHIVSFRATPQAEPRNLVMGAQTHSNGPFHARQAHLRGNSTTHLTLQGVPGAVGTSTYTHDVMLTQHGFSKPVAQGLVAEGGFHLMQGTLTSSDSADQFMIEGYGAGTKLAYGGADLAMLGAWFDLSSDDWGRPMAFSGTQWIVSAGLEREMTFGAARLIPQARGFWQRTNIEEQGAISFSDEMVFTGKAGLAIELGTHAFDVFFTRDDEASSLDTGLVQNHRMEEAIEAGWRSYSVADGFSLTGELRYRHGLETGVDSYSAGVALTRAF